MQAKMDALAAAQARQASSGSEVLTAVEKMMAQLSTMAVPAPDPATRKELQDAAAAAEQRAQVGRLREGGCPPSFWLEEGGTGDWGV